jgi:pyruvate/oxaloacetate carboxyltransferase
VSTIRQALPAATNHCSAELSKVAAATAVAAAVEFVAASVAVLRPLSVSAASLQHESVLELVQHCKNDVGKGYKWQMIRYVFQLTDAISAAFGLIADLSLIL